MSKRILITGVASCSGRHLVQHLRATRGLRLFGCDLRKPVPPVDGIDFRLCDIRREQQVARLVRAVRPDVVYHLAGVADESDPASLFAVNLLGTCHLLQACAGLKPKPRVLLVGTAAVYPDLPRGRKGWDENAPLRLRTLYASSRHSAFEAGLLWCAMAGLPVCLCRPFNLIGPGLRPGLAATDLLRRALECKRAGHRRMEIRNPDAVRDFLDVRDAVRAYRLIVEKAEPGVPYNVCSGRGRTLRELAAAIGSAIGWKLEIRALPRGRGPQRSVVRRSIGDFSRLQKATGWRPAIPFGRSVRDMVKTAG